MIITLTPRPVQVQGRHEGPLPGAPAGRILLAAPAAHPRRRGQPDGVLREQGRSAQAQEASGLILRRKRYPHTGLPDGIFPNQKSKFG
jgi:hypothetical protein